MRKPMRISGLRRDRWVGKGAENGAEREIRTPEAVRPAVFETAAIPGLAISAWLPQSSTCIFSLGPLISMVVGHRAIRRGTNLQVRLPSEASVSGRSSIPFRAGRCHRLRSYDAEESFPEGYAMIARSRIMRMFTNIQTLQL